MSTYKITRTGLDLRDPKGVLVGSRPEWKKSLDYVLLDPLKGNDHLFGDFLVDVGIAGDTVVALTVDLSKIPSTSDKGSIERFIDLVIDWREGYWRPFLGATSPILFITGLPTRPKENVPEMVKHESEVRLLKNSSMFSDLGLWIPDTSKGIEDIENWKDYFGASPERVLRPISILHYSKELEDAMDGIEEGCEKWGYEIDGGDLNKEMENQAFGRYFVLSFAAFHSDVVLLSSSYGLDPTTNNELDYLGECRGTEIDNPKKFEMKKSVEKLQKPPKQVIYSSLKMGNGWIVPAKGSEVTYYPSEIKFDFAQESPSFETSPRLKAQSWSPLEQEVLDTIIPQTVSGEEWRSYNWRVLCNLVPEMLAGKFSTKDGWSFGFVQLSEYVLSIHATQVKTEKKKRWMGKKRKVEEPTLEYRQFLLALGDRSNVYFIDLMEEVDWDEGVEEGIIDETPETADGLQG